MLLTAHIIIALSSLINTAILYLKPTPIKFKASYGLVGATFLSGVLLIVQKPAAMAHVCIMGIIFIASSLVLINLAKHKYATQKIINE